MATGKFDNYPLTGWDVANDDSTAWYSGKSTIDYSTYTSSHSHHYNKIFNETPITGPRLIELLVPIINNLMQCKTYEAENIGILSNMMDFYASSQKKPPIERDVKDEGDIKTIRHDIVKICPHALIGLRNHIAITLPSLERTLSRAIEEEKKYNTQKSSNYTPNHYEYTANYVGTFPSTGYSPTYTYTTPPTWSFDGATTILTNIANFYIEANNVKKSISNEAIQEKIDRLNTRIDKCRTYLKLKYGEES